MRIVGQNVQGRKEKKKKRNTPIYFDTNYRTEMKLVQIIMDYCLLQFLAPSQVKLFSIFYLKKYNVIYQ